MYGSRLCRGDLLIRAARHYEGAMQILVRHAVRTAQEVQYPSTDIHMGMTGRTD